MTLTNPTPEFEIHEVEYSNITKIRDVETEGVLAECSCGAKWVHSVDVTEEQKLSIFNSHLGYAKRAATRID